MVDLINQNQNQFDNNSNINVDLQSGNSTCR